MHYNTNLAPFFTLAVAFPILPVHIRYFEIAIKSAERPCLRQINRNPSHQSEDMSHREQQHLNSIETKMSLCGRSSLEFGRGLNAIRESRLHLETDRSFSIYLLRRWGINRAQAYRLIKAASLFDRLRPYARDLKVAIPTTERQLRLLEGIESPVQCCRVMARAAKIALGKPIRCRHIRESIRLLRIEDAPPTNGQNTDNP